MWRFVTQGDTLELKSLESHSKTYYVSRLKTWKNISEFQKWFCSVKPDCAAARQGQHLPLPRIVCQQWREINNSEKKTRLFCVGAGRWKKEMKVHIRFTSMVKLQPKSYKAEREMICYVLQNGNSILFYPFESMKEHATCHMLTYHDIRGHSQMTLQHWTTNGNLKSWQKLTRRD